MSKINPWYVEGKAKFIVGNAFYNPNSKLVRNLGILAATLHRLDRGSLRVLDAMSGCGVRSLRYWLESNADWLWVNEGNPELKPILEQNLAKAIASGCCQITYLDAHRLFFDCYLRRDFYDLVDVDCFGAAVPYLDTMLWATKIGGLMYLTSTDGRTATGHLPQNSLKAYGVYARSHPASQEQVLRLLIGSVQQRAASKGMGVEPIFALFTGQTYRIMFRLLAHQRLTEKNYAFLGYCYSCGHYQTVSWQRLGREVCPHDHCPLTISGPMWLGELHYREKINRMKLLAKEWQWTKVADLLTVMAAEANLPPYFYTLREIGRRGALDLPKRSRLIEALQQAGYRATATHISAEAIKTDANIHTCIAIAQKLRTI